jgi:hypothetical protein
VFIDVGDGNMPKSLTPMNYQYLFEESDSDASIPRWH